MAFGSKVFGKSNFRSLLVARILSVYHAHDGTDIAKLMLDFVNVIETCVNFLISYD
jgi:hypothetical protein